LSDGTNDRYGTEKGSMMQATTASEQALRDEVSLQNLTTTNAEIAKGIRLSGSEAEAEAFAFIAKTCAEYGLTVQQYAVDAYVSLPGAASLSVLTPEERPIECITHSFSSATGTAGLTAPLVYVGAGGAEDYAGVDVRGAIALVEGLAGPGKAVEADRAGAAGMICINAAGLHEMIISPVWGTPTPETAPLLPKVVAVSVRKESGEYLKALCRGSVVSVRLVAAVMTGWKAIPMLTADIPGTQEDRFVLFSGHVDSWHYGAMDNASANATQLEVARILSAHRDTLRRGMRFAFWSGHSHARYGTSAWYADNMFADLYAHCVCHVNSESTGAVGATDLTRQGNMAETWQFAAGPVAAVAGQKVQYHRMGRNSDQSFTGIGIPSVYSGLSSPGTGGAAAWWHTPDDTLDKIDGANHVRDTQVYLTACWQLCTAAILPFDYAETATELADRLQTLQEHAGDRFDLASLITAVQDVRSAAEAVNTAVSRGEAGDTERVNAALIAAGHALIPVNYTSAGPFSVDMALEALPLPGLTALITLTELAPTSDDARFLTTRLVRERNRIAHALTNAKDALASALR